MRVSLRDKVRLLIPSIFTAAWSLYFFFRCTTSLSFLLCLVPLRDKVLGRGGAQGDWFESGLVRPWSKRLGGPSMNAY